MRLYFLLPFLSACFAVSVAAGTIPLSTALNPREADFEFARPVPDRTQDAATPWFRGFGLPHERLHTDPRPKEGLYQQQTVPWGMRSWFR